MKHFYSIYDATCDAKSKRGCHKSKGLYLEPSETEAEAEEFLRRSGWEIAEDGYMACPMCNKGISKKEVEQIEKRIGAGLKLAVEEKG
jgi:uncharacterized protein with PIN domain